jgi:preprotein translocase subunit SecF
MKRLHELNIDFMRHLNVMVAISGVLVLLALTQLLVGRLNMGIDFAGGTQLIVRFLEEPEIDEVRAVLAEAGMGEVQIQRFGEQERNEIIIKTPLLPDRQEGSRGARPGEPLRERRRPARSQRDRGRDAHLALVRERSRRALGRG